MLLGSKISAIHLPSKDDVLVQSSHGRFIEEGDKGGFGIFVFYPSVRGLSLKFSGELAGWPISLRIMVQTHLEVEG